MNLEERVKRLENFMGNIEKITSVYANSVQEICDKYLNLLYIETKDVNHPETLVLDGFLSELDTIADVPHNVCFNVRPSHDFAYAQSGPAVSKLKLKRGNKYIEVGLKKYDVENPGTLIYLEPGDYKEGLLYSIYIDSQNIAIISSNDTGTIALQEVTQLNATVQDLADDVAAMAATQTVGSIAVTTGTIANLTVSEALSVSNAFVIPEGTTCSTPNAGDNSTKVANTAYVDRAITAAINDYHNNYHIFTTGDPVAALQDAAERAICYKY